MGRPSDDLRRQVIARAREKCEYCQAQEKITGELEVDHIVPVSAGGKTSLDNLCLACRHCNQFKLGFQSATDPQTGQSADLYNPRQQQWPEHFAWSDDGTQVIGLTPTGRATIERLRMNREKIVRSRRIWVQAGWHPPKD